MALERFGVFPGAAVLCPARSGSRLSEADVIDIAADLHLCPSLTSVDLTHASMTTEAAAALGRALLPSSHAGNVHHLCLADTGLQPAGVVDLVRALAAHDSLEALELQRNPLRDEGAASLAQLVTASSVRSIDIGYCKIGPAGCTALGRALEAAPRLRSLVLANNKLRAPGCAALCEGLADNKVLRVLDVAGNGISADGGTALAAMLRRNTALEHVDLSRNFLSVSVPELLAALAGRPTPLRFLDLGGNCITGQAMREAAEALGSDRIRVACLSLDSNPLGPDGLVALYGALRGTDLQFLDVTATELAGECGVVLSDLIGSCPRLGSLQVDNNPLMGDDAVSEVALALGRSPALAALNAERTGSGERTAQAVGDAVALKHRGLRAVNLANNAAGLPLATVLQLLGQLAKGTCLEFLDLSGLELPETEPLLAALVRLFAVNPKMERVVLQHTPVGAAMPDGIMSRELSDALAAAAERAEQHRRSTMPAAGGTAGAEAGGKAADLTVAGGADSTASTVRRSGAGGKSGIAAQAGITGVSLGGVGGGGPSALAALQTTAAVFATPSRINATIGSVGASALTTATATGTGAGALVPGTAGGSLAAGASRAELTRRTAALMRPSWAVTVPVDAAAEEEDAEGPEDGAKPPRVPHPLSLHDSLYPGYGKGRFSSASLVQSLSDPLPYNIAVSRGAPRPFIPTGDGYATLVQPPRAPLKRSPYALETLESNAGRLPVTADQLRRKFSELDVDASGDLDRREFARLYASFQRFGVPTPEREVTEQFERTCQTKPGRVTFEEFSILMLRLAAM